MNGLELGPQHDCRWDLVALGEVMLRLDPGEERIATTRSFRVWEGVASTSCARPEALLRSTHRSGHRTRRQRGGAGEYRGSALLGVRDSEREAYQHVVHKHPREGWRLVQIFAPGTAAFGVARYDELIFERARSESARPENTTTE